jgi:MEDS: MEthanogen/methylotroph, DcmR Sensory domain
MILPGLGFFQKPHQLPRRPWATVEPVALALALAPLSGLRQNGISGYDSSDLIWTLYRTKTARRSKPAEPSSFRELTLWFASLRRKDVNLMGEMTKGTHVCLYYESIDDLIETAVVPFFKTGLEKSEFCVWIPSKLMTLEQSRMALGRRIPNFDRYLAA